MTPENDDPRDTGESGAPLPYKYRYKYLHKYGDESPRGEHDGDREDDDEEDRKDRSGDGEDEGEKKGGEKQEDKDKNDKEIYEGDICRGPNGKHWVIQWIGHSWCMTNEIIPSDRMKFAGEETYTIDGWLDLPPRKQALQVIQGHRVLQGSIR